MHTLFGRNRHDESNRESPKLKFASGCVSEMCTRHNTGNEHDTVCGEARAAATNTSGAATNTTAGWSRLGGARMGARAVCRGVGRKREARPRAMSRDGDTTRGSARDGGARRMSAGRRRERRWRAVDGDENGKTLGFRKSPFFSSLLPLA